MNSDQLVPLPIIPYDASDMAELARFRYQAWLDAGINTKLFPQQSWSDDHDPIRMHWISRNQEGSIVASASLGIHDQIGDVDEAEVYIDAGIEAEGLIGAPARVTVLNSYRKHGFATRLLDVQENTMRVAGVRFAVRQSSPAMQRLLIPRGWVDHGPAPFDERFPDIQFHIMSWTHE